MIVQHFMDILEFPHTITVMGVPPWLRVVSSPLLVGMCQNSQFSWYHWKGLFMAFPTSTSSGKS